jgi:alpha-tubulin suppressor-like RCC1 family protein
MKTEWNLVRIWLVFCTMLQALTSGAQTVTKISAEWEHSLFLKSNGSLWATGYNYFGQLGDGTYGGTYAMTNFPEQIVASNVTAIAAGYDHSLFLKSDGSLWAMGDNQDGELGDNTTDSGNYNTNRPERIVASGVTAVAAGQYFSLFLKSNGSLWGMGLNQYGQLGNGTYNTATSPVQILAGNVTAIAAGWYHSLFLKSDGSLWAMGFNHYGQLGDGTYNNTNAPEMIVASNVTAIAGGYWHSLFLKNDGSLWAMGENGNGQLGDGTGYNTNRPEMILSSNVTAIAAGYEHSLFLKSDGSLWAMGFNYYGQLGDGTFSFTRPYGAFAPEQILSSNVTAIAAGQYHSLLLKSDGSLWGMGYDSDGELGAITPYNVSWGFSGTSFPIQIVAGSSQYNQVSVKLLSVTNALLSFMGNAGENYALDRASKLSPANWIPQLTNTAGSGGVLVFSNTASKTLNNFWRIRSVP